MKKNELVALTSIEMISIDGGKPLCYHLGETAGFVAGTIVSFFAGFLHGISGEEKQ